MKKIEKLFSFLFYVFYNPFCPIWPVMIIENIKSPLVNKIYYVKWLLATFSTNDFFEFRLTIFLSCSNGIGIHFTIPYLNITIAIPFPESWELWLAKKTTYMPPYYYWDVEKQKAFMDEHFNRIQKQYKENHAEKEGNHGC